MALTLFHLTKLNLIATLLLFFYTSTVAWSEKYDEFAKTSISPTKKLEKLTHLHFYIYQNLTGTNPNVVRVAEAAGITNKSTTLFGAINVIDVPIQVGPESSSMKIGRAQGIEAFTSQEDTVVVLAGNFAFTQGKFNGSTLTILGLNPVLHKERELPLIGGTGLFRLSRGYVKTSTYLDDPKEGIAILEYHVYVYY